MRTLTGVRNGTGSWPGPKALPNLRLDQPGSGPPPSCHGDRLPAGWVSNEVDDRLPGRHRWPSCALLFRLVPLLLQVRSGLLGVEKLEPGGGESERAFTTPPSPVRDTNSDEFGPDSAIVWSILVIVGKTWLKLAPNWPNPKNSQIQKMPKAHPTQAS